MPLTPLQTTLRTAPDDALLPRLTAQLCSGQDPNAASHACEAPVRLAVDRARMDALALLIEHGADLAPLRWSALHRATALGPLAEVAARLPGAETSARDAAGLTPFLLAVQIGAVAKAAALLPATAPGDRYRRHDRAPALVIAAERAQSAMVAWLLAAGFDVDEPMPFGRTALFAAVLADSTEVVAQLLAAGARIDARDNRSAAWRRDDPGLWSDAPDYFVIAANETRSPEMARLLLQAGADLGDFPPGTLAQFTGSRLIPPQHITPEIFHAQKHRRFGITNPEPVAPAYWLEAIRGKAGGYRGRRDFGLATNALPAIWSFDRFGMSTTELPDGRWVQIAGEHEDFYDPDFCIYSDVFVFDGVGGVQIYLYPRAVFPPTDHHSATLVGNAILLIGGNGDREDREAGTTQVLRLRLQDFAIERVATTGDGPGWISRHRARRVGDTILVSGGRVWDGEDLVENDACHALSLTTWRWTRLAGDGAAAAPQR